MSGLESDYGEDFVVMLNAIIHYLHFTQVITNVHTYTTVIIAKGSAFNTVKFGMNLPKNIITIKSVL